MNERIKELAEQAGLTSAEYNGFDRMDLTPSEKKFAELIVRECLNQFQDPSPPKISNEEHQKLVDATYMLAVNFSVAKIKKHFGVE
jgi:hypothetical protein